MNRFTEAVTGILDRHGGSVVEFAGDGAMAVFGAPEALPGKERAALDAGYEIVLWTAIGNTMNLAARLQDLTRELDADIVIDAVTWRRAGAAASSRRGGDGVHPADAPRERALSPGDSVVDAAEDLLHLLPTERGIERSWSGDRPGRGHPLVNAEAQGGGQEGPGMADQYRRPSRDGGRVIVQEEAGQDMLADVPGFNYSARSEPAMGRLQHAVLVLAAVSAATLATAECQKDSRGSVVCGRGACVADIRGNVFCAKYRHGAVVRMVNGAILCGKGECASTMKGEWFCSSDEDGSVFKDWDGSIRCSGGCEPASVASCETAPAGH